MTGIDSTLGSMLTSRLDALIENVGAGARTATTQTGASAEATDTSTAPIGGAIPVADAPPPASAQAILSEVALTLDAISRFGGEATQPVLGEAPIWPAPPAIDAQPATDAGSVGSGAAATSASDGTAMSGGAAASASSTAATAATSAAALPVEALAAALEKTVAETGLFYESHLAQWLAGSYPADLLANEPQTRLAAAAAQLSFDWEQPASAGTDGSEAFFGAPPASSAFASAAGVLRDGAALATALLQHATGSQSSASPMLPGDPRMSASAYAGARPLPGQPGAATAFGNSADSLRSAATGAAGASARSASGLGASGDPFGGAPASVAASIHPATIPLVRQQLDLLATEQFRWTGEVWPGTKLDWTIEPEPDRYRGPGEQGAPDEQAWRTRLTLALPTLGTVDADLVLKGTSLVVRVQASPAGAARLATGGEAFGRRLRAAGIELTGLTIREVGGADPAATADAVQAATAAYARAAAAATDAQAHDATAAPDAVTASGAGEGWRGSPTPLEGLFDDPFEWSGT
ncbi:flagellar hook-length control protein FliK [Trinickia symbiotica]|uniref:Flagellar hook-length control protein FliK n=1 Tax=Trinickia symbiotica TaxID=863227 RepID=A0A2N7WMV7_9BURK|nr:flagellar hook-length control protein FliK [Trinickia symbiotica]PMS30787.1 flagellar hook-length control protein FliK [Trinickia symbiotica]PPK41488.1 flagellar hook-length control protein FliK [Trinickia symbiotica]